MGRIWAEQQCTPANCSGTAYAPAYTYDVAGGVTSATAGTLASASSDHTIKLWDATSGEAMRTLQGHSGWVCSVAFSPDGRILESGSGDYTIKLWDVTSVQK